ncbi:MAG: ssl1498 family light-harvesting-like protein [Leptolyngbyaceae cyanobacterium MAG.088]|nr:ssl1498 family light-harvesting-like protein [Leptolyngbyaceae cyanobacterium MAG.088]
MINNFAKDPIASAAEYPSRVQQRRYWVMGAFTAVFMTGVLVIAFAFS